MAKIKLKEGWYVVAQDREYELHNIRETTGKTAKKDVRDVVIGYFGNLGSAVYRCAELSNNYNDDMFSVAEYCSAFREDVTKMCMEIGEKIAEYVER